MFSLYISVQPIIHNNKLIAHPDADHTFTSAYNIMVYILLLGIEILQKEGSYRRMCYDIQE